MVFCRTWGCVLTSLIDMWVSSFPSTTCRRDCLFRILYSCLLTWRLILCLLLHLQIFSPTLCLFIFMVSFAVQKLLNLIRSHLFIFVFIFITLGGRSKKILLWFMSARIVAFYSLQHPWLNTLQAWHCFLCCVLITSLLLVDSF